MPGLVKMDTYMPELAFAQTATSPYTSYPLFRPRVAWSLHRCMVVLGWY